ncbi:collagen, type I, alpha 1b-like [Oryctolagus cuniculus]|uniref:collagen, type I, alpha 1b-like n=1 Tax=Oryctolagus cuniculus TaxID=9986 RepID=UPI003879C09C
MRVRLSKHRETEERRAAGSRRTPGAAVPRQGRSQTGAQSVLGTPGLPRALRGHGGPIPCNPRKLFPRTRTSARMQSWVGARTPPAGRGFPARPPSSGSDLPTPRADRSLMNFPAASLTAAFQPETKTIPQAAKRPLQRDPNPPREDRKQPRHAPGARANHAEGASLAGGCGAPRAEPALATNRSTHLGPGGEGLSSHRGPPRRGASRARRVQTCCVLPDTPTRSDNTSPAEVSAVAGALALAPARSAPHARHKRCAPGPEGKPAGEENPRAARGGSPRCHRSGSSPSARPGDGDGGRGRGQRCHPRAALSSPSPGPRQPPPPLPGLIKVCGRPRRPPDSGPGPRRVAPRGASARAAPAPTPAARPPASYLGQRRRSPAADRSSRRSPDKQLSGEGRGEPLFEKVSHFPSLTGRLPAPLRAPRLRAPARARARAPSPRRPAAAAAPAAASRRSHLETVPDGRAVTRAPVTDSSSQNGGGGGGGGGGGVGGGGEGARTREGPPGRGGRAGPSGGRAEAAPQRAHTRTHALPLRPRPLPARGAARPPRGTVQPVGDARQLQGRPQLPPPRPAARPDGACTPAAPRMTPRERPAPPGALRASRRPHPGRSAAAAAAADLISAGRAEGGNRVPLVSLLAACRPPPRSAAPPDPLVELVPVPGRPAPLRVTAAVGEGQGAARSGAAGSAARRPRPGWAKSVTWRGAPRLRGNRAAASRPRSGPGGRTHPPGGCGQRRGGQRGSVHTYSGPGGVAWLRVSHPRIVRAARSAAAALSHRERSCKAEPTLPRAPAVPHPPPGVCEAAAAAAAAAEGGAACQVQPPALPPGLPPGALTLEGSCTPNAKPPASWVSLCTF